MTPAAKKRQRVFFKLLAMILALLALLSALVISGYSAGVATPSVTRPDVTTSDVATPGVTTSGRVTEIITAFEDLPEEVLYQGYDFGAVSLENLELPDTLAAFDKSDSPIEITGVKWESSPAFDPSVSIDPPGYIFTSVLPEGYEPAEGVKSPVITVFIRPVGGVGIVPLVGPGTYSINGGSLVIDSDGNYTITGTGISTANTITVNSNKTVNITLNGVNISSSGCAFNIMNGATVNLTLDGTNKLTSSSSYAGLQAPLGTTLTIDGAGSLTATGSSGSAGIGGGFSNSGGNITINSGNITAIGCSGIGSGHTTNSGTITINGGVVKASVPSGHSGAGIGAGAGGTSTGTIRITGGEVTATGGSASSTAGGAGIGGGYNGNGGNIEISGGKVIAKGGSNAAGIGGGSGGGGGKLTLSSTDEGSIIAIAGGGNAMAIGRGTNSSTDGDITIEAPIYYWTNTSNQDPQAPGKKNDEEEFANDASYKYIRIEWNPDALFFSGPTAMTLPAGYADTFTDEYTLTGQPPLTVTQDTNHGGKILWNDVTKKLDITSELPAGKYTVKLTANDDGNSFPITLAFTLTVTATLVPPSISGPTEMRIPLGYADTFAGTYRVSGSPTLVVTQNNNYGGKIKWNNTTKMLDIEAGLAAGDYTVRLTVSNGVSPNATLNFILTVTDVPPFSPRISGPTSMTLPVGYAATFTDTYTVDGYPTPTVTQDNDHGGRIVWNDTTKTLDITPGLPVGSYPITLTAGNGVPSDITLDFILTVTNAPTIDGPRTMTLPEGYMDVSTGVYNITGSPPPTVTLNNTHGNKIVWNNTTRKLDVTAGLPSGGYTVTLTASNGTSPDATLKFTLTVAAIPPTINNQVNGTNTINLAEGYGAYSRQYTIFGIPTPVLSVSGIAGATINNGVLTIPAGLKAAGSPYTVVITAENEEGTATMTVTVYVARPPQDGGSIGSRRSASVISDHFAITGYMTKDNIQKAIKQAQESGSNLVKTRAAYSEGHILIKPQVSALMKGHEYIHDTTGSPVQVRVQFPEPAKVKSTVYLCGAVTGGEVDKVKTLFEQSSGCDIRVVDFHQKEPWGQTVKLAARIDFTGMDTQNLYFYSHDKEAKKYKKIETTYSIDKKGYIHFTSVLAGTIVISSGSLSKEVQNPTTDSDGITGLQSPSNGDSEITGLPSPSNGDSEMTGSPSPSNGDSGITDSPSPSNGDSGIIDSPSPSNDNSGTTGLPSPSNGDSGTTGSPSPSNGDSGMTGSPSPSNGDSGTTGSPSPSKDGFSLNMPSIELAMKPLKVIWISAAALILLLCLWAFIPRKDDEYVTLEEFHRGNK